VIVHILAGVVLSFVAGMVGKRYDHEHWGPAFAVGWFLIVAVRFVSEVML
jgi:hypothetical protein